MKKTYDYLVLGILGFLLIISPISYKNINFSSPLPEKNIVIDNSVTLLGQSEKSPVKK